MTRAKRVDEATVRTQQGDEVTLAAMDDGSLAVLTPGTTAWSVVSLVSGPTGTRLRMKPRAIPPADELDDADELGSNDAAAVEG